MAKNKKKNYQTKKKTSPADKMVNAVITVVIIAVLGLAVWAVSPKFKAKFDEIKAAEEASKPDTIQKRADQKGISVEQFIADYGITGENVTGETMMSEVMAQMTVENAAKLEEQSVEEFLEASGLPADKVTGDMTLEAANELIPIKTVIASAGMDFETFKAQYGLADDVTEDTPWKDVEETVMAVEQANQEAAAAAEAQATEEATAEEGDTAEETPAEEKTDAQDTTEAAE